MKYIVFYRNSYLEDARGVAAPLVQKDKVEFQLFDSQQEAITFAIKNDGYVLVPLEIEHKLVNKREG